MGFELPDGKTARNLQDQVKFLSEKLKDLYAAFNDSGLKKIVIVEELPEVGDPTVLYLLAKEDPEEGDYYDEYLWYDNQWELIGSTQIDLSDCCTLSTDQTLTGTKTIGDGSDNASPKVYFKDSYFTAGFRLQAYTFQLDSGLQLSGDILPDTNGGKNIGSSSFYWSNIYTQGKIYLNDNSGADSGVVFESKSDGGTITAKSVYIAVPYLYTQDLKPYSTNTYTLGSSNQTWKDLYLSGNIDFGNGALIRKDTSDRVNISYNGLVKLKVGNETYVVGHLRPDANNSYDLGYSSYLWRNFYLAGQIKDGNNASYGLVIPNTTGWTANKTISTTVIKQHSVVCANGTLTILTNYAQSATSGSTVSAACSVALSLKWNGYPALYCSGTVVHYYDYADLTIKSASLGTINSDTITDY